MNKLEAYIRNFYKKYSHKLSIPTNAANEKRIQITIYIIFTLISSSLLIMFAIQPALATISNLQQQLEDSKQVESAMSAKLQALSMLDAEYETLTPLLPGILESIPKQANIAAVTRQIEKLAGANQLTISGINVDHFQLTPDAAIAPQTGSILYSITVKGTSDQVDQFIHDIFSFERIMSIESISKSADDKGAVSVSLQGKVFYLN